MLESVKVLIHSSIKIDKEVTIYIDPFKINQDFNDADLIFITHSHFDHYSEEDILKVKKQSTKIILTNDIVDNAIRLGFDRDNILVVEPNKDYEIDNIEFSTIPAYNINKQFHPRVNNWVGYIIDLDNIKYYIAGDTDITEENKNVKCDVAFIPIGGTYTVTYKEAAELTNIIKPKIVVPIHYGSIVGNKEDAIKFKELLEEDIECVIMI